MSSSRAGAGRPEIESWRYVDQDDKPGQEFDRLNLRRRWSRPSADWLLYLDRDGTVVALPAAWNGRGVYRPTERTENVAVASIDRMLDLDVRAEFRQAFGTELDGDTLKVVFETLVRLVHTEGSGSWGAGVGQAAVQHVETRALRSVTAGNVARRTMPTDLRNAGWEVDEDYQQGGINASMRVTSPSGLRFYVKEEESPEAAAAEVLVSSLASTLGFPGLAARTVLAGDERTVVSPALGDEQVADEGAFLSYFKDLPNETQQTINASRARFLKRVSLADLQLRDSQQVTRFLVLNAAVGNSDRHGTNINYGWETDLRSAYGGFGHLLPLDHGRTCLANTGLPMKKIAGTPASAVIGDIGNPHQLLRPFAELLDIEPEVTVGTVTSTATVLASEIERLLADNSWSGWHPVLTQLLQRCETLANAPEELCDAVSAVVVR